MMLRNLVHEVVRRRLWPVPIAAVVIAIAAPLLFMKSAPQAAPDTAQPPAAAPGKLPANAERLVSTTDKAVVSHKKSKRKGQDPFAPPSSGAAKPDAQTAAAPVTAAPAATSPGATAPVVIQNSDGSTTTMAPPKATTKKATTRKKKKKTTTTKPPTTKPTTTKPPTTKPTTTPKVTTPPPTTSSASTRTATVTYVDVRFGRRMDTMLRYRVPRLQTFRAGGKVAAMFVHYSTTRDLAVFAIAPSTTVAGDVECRKVKDVCRYVDIPAGSYARLRLRGEDGTLISRRLDVVSIRTLPLAGNEDPMPLVTTLGVANCLLKGVLKLPVSLPSISADACG